MACSVPFRLLCTMLQHLITYFIFTTCLWPAIVCQQLPRPAIRVRLNRGIFDQTSSIIAGLIEYEVPRVQMSPTHQCFTEGCVHVHTFRMNSFRQPTVVAFTPSPPNQFAIRVQDFDFYITGQLTGNIQIIIQIPVSGSVHISGSGIAVTAYADLQKTLDDSPYLRFVQCSIDGGIIDARVGDMGLLTDTVNTKYKHLMSTQSKVQMEEAICNHMNRLTQQHFSTRLSRIPKSISVKDLVEMMIINSPNPTTKSLMSLPPEQVGPKRARARARLWHRNKRAAANDDYYDDVAAVEGTPTTTSAPRSFIPPKKINFTPNDINHFFNLNRLAHLLIDMTLLDSASTTQDFSVGMSGKVYSTKIRGDPPSQPPFPFRLPKKVENRMVEVYVSEYTANSLLYQAHRTNSLLFHIDSQTPGIGKLLKTTCSVDEVCISDQIEEIGKTYPGRSLELIIRTTQPPILNITSDSATLQFTGRCLFFIEGTRQKIGVIPFTALIRINARTVGNVLKGSMTIPQFALIDGVDFFGLSARQLDGLRTSTQIGLETLINANLADGIPLQTHTLRLPLRISSPILTLVPNQVQLEVNADIYNSLYGRWH